jgi:hypothetical protein
MKNSKLAAACLVAALPLATIAATAGAGSADAAAPHAKVTANVMSKHPTSAHVFGVRGTFTAKGKPVANRLVKIQAERKDGSWRGIKGAQRLTSSKGTYRIGVLVNAAGLHHLRVVGIGEGGQSNVRHGFDVRVYR